jgi:GntR family transcriptional regulator / MocR family aminotransferase
MPRRADDPELALGRRPAGLTLSQWIYEDLRRAILEGRLQPGAKLPASRNFAETQGVSRRVVVGVYERLAEEGYLAGEKGSGTRVRASLGRPVLPGPSSRAPLERIPDIYKRPARPFRPIESALDEFPLDLWNRTAARAARQASIKSLAGGDALGSLELRRAIAEHLGAQRGVAASAGEIVVTSGTQQSLDLLARVLIRPGNAVWIEDPGYPGAVDAFRTAGAKIVPVRVDAEGIDLAQGQRLYPRPLAVYLTPAHQFGTGVALSPERRFALLDWARASGVLVIEDDYDSEFRFRGRPIPAMKALDGGDSIFLLGSFNKILFPSLRIGFLVVPEAWIDKLVELRYQSDRYPAALPQAALARFMDEGHFSRHLRRMRGLYGERRQALERDIGRYLKGSLELPEIPAGLNTPAFLRSGLNSKEAAARANAHGIETWPLDRFALRRRDLNGLLLGFAAFNEREIRAGVQTLARALQG